MALPCMQSLSPVFHHSQLPLLLECAIFSYYLSSCSQTNYYFYNHFGWTLNLNVGSSFPIFVWSAICTFPYFTETFDFSSFLPSFLPPFLSSTEILVPVLSHCCSFSSSPHSAIRVSGTTLKPQILALAAGARSCKYSTCKTPNQWEILGKQGSGRGFL